MKRKECAIVQSNITKLKEEFTDLNERNKLLKEIMRLNQSLKPRLASQNPTELGGCATLPDIHRRGAQVLRVYDSQNARVQRQPSLWARDSHSTPSLPSIDKTRQRPVPSYAQERAGLCGQRGTKASLLTSECKYRIFSKLVYLNVVCEEMQVYKCSVFFHFRQAGQKLNKYHREKTRVFSKDERSFSVQPQEAKRTARRR